MQPRRLVLMTGTGTEVGKTWWAAVTLAALRRDGVRVGARKPAQSFEPGAGPTDAEVLAAATGERPEDVCPQARSYPVAMAPPMAADALGRASFTIRDLVAETRWPEGVEVGIVEGAGGPRSPLAADGDTVDLARALAPDLVVLVATAGLGTINAVRLSVAALDGHEIVVGLNRVDETDDVHQRNRACLVERYGLCVVTEPGRLAVLLAAP